MPISKPAQCVGLRMEQTRARVAETNLSQHVVIQSRPPKKKGAFLSTNAAVSIMIHCLK